MPMDTPTNPTDSERNTPIGDDDASSLHGSDVGNDTQKRKLGPSATDLKRILSASLYKKLQHTIKERLIKEDLYTSKFKTPEEKRRMEDFAAQLARERPIEHELSEKQFKDHILHIARTLNNEKRRRKNRTVYVPDNRNMADRNIIVQFTNGNARMKSYLEDFVPADMRGDKWTIEAVNFDLFCQQAKGFYKWDGPGMPYLQCRYNPDSADVDVIQNEANFRVLLREIEQFDQKDVVVSFQLYEDREAQVSSAVEDPVE